MFCSSKCISNGKDIESEATSKAVSNAHIVDEEKMRSTSNKEIDTQGDLDGDKGSVHVVCNAEKPLLDVFMSDTCTLLCHVMYKCFLNYIHDHI